MAVLGLAKPIKDLAFQLEFTSLAHLVQKLTAYEHYHPDLYIQISVDQANNYENLLQLNLANPTHDSKSFTARSEHPTRN